MNEQILSASVPSTRKKIAVGNDLVYLPAFRSSFTQVFKEKVYTQQERDYCDLFTGSLQAYASTWAAKEAVYKAMKQVHAITLPFDLIEITRQAIGKKPTVVIHKTLSCPTDISLTISHDGDYAWAIAIIELT